MYYYCWGNIHGSFATSTLLRWSSPIALRYRASTQHQSFLHLQRAQTSFGPTWAEQRLRCSQTRKLWVLCKSAMKIRLFSAEREIKSISAVSIPCYFTWHSGLKTYTVFFVVVSSQLLVSHEHSSKTHGLFCSIYRSLRWRTTNASVATQRERLPGA